MSTLGRVSSHRLFFYGWVNVAVTTVGLLATAGVRSASGALLVAMEGATGWSAAAVPP